MERARLREQWLPIAHLRRDFRALIVGGDVGPVDEYTPFGERASEAETAIPGDIKALKSLVQRK